MKYLLGIDFGGGSSKATLIDTTGNIIAESTAEYPTYYPTPDACEQRAEDWQNALVENISVLKAKSGIDIGDILCVAIDSATHTAVLCDDKKCLYALRFIGRTAVQHKNQRNWVKNTARKF